MKDKLLTTREVANLLDMSEKDVIDLANAGLLPHFKIAGEFLRFKKEEILKIKDNIRKKYNLPSAKVSFFERIREFLYFNDFYIVSAILIIFLLFIIFKDFSF